MSRLALLLSFAGCASSHTTFAYDVSRAGTGAGATVATGGDQPGGHVAVGFGSSQASMDVVLAGHDLTTRDDPWLAGSAGLELSLRFVLFGPVKLFAHGGPTRGIVVDTTTGAVTWGAGLVWGAGLSVGRGGVHLVIDARREDQWLADSGDQMHLGNFSLRTLAVGLAFGRR